MLEHWLQPVKLERINGYEALEPYQLGRHIHCHTQEYMPNLKRTHIALIGIGPDCDAVRSALYALSYPFEAVFMADLGDFRKTDTAFLSPFIAELLAGGVLPLLIGQGSETVKAQFEAYFHQKQSVNMALIDEKIRYSAGQQKSAEHYLNDFLADPFLFNCSIIGYQSHFTDPSVVAVFDEKNYEIRRLGRTKGQFEDIEPLIRDADMVHLNIGALKHSEVPGQNQGSPNGFTVEEACQLARYAGMSDKLTSLSLTGFVAAADVAHQTAQGIAHIIWYVVDGFANRQQDYPIAKAYNQLTQYVVDVSTFDYKITFWRSNKTGRWWMEVPLSIEGPYKRHQLVPCSHQDYLQACSDDLPQRLINAVLRLTERRD